MSPHATLPFKMIMADPIRISTRIARLLLIFPPPCQKSTNPCLKVKPFIFPQSEVELERVATIRKIKFACQVLNNPCSKFSQRMESPHIHPFNNLKILRFNQVS